MFKGAIWNNKNKEAKEDVQAVSISGLTLGKQAYAASTPKVKVRLGDVVVDTMLDTGAEVNVITKALADQARLTV